MGGYQQKLRNTKVVKKKKKILSVLSRDYPVLSIRYFGVIR